MRASPLVAVVLAFLPFSGCFGADLDIESSRPAPTPSVPWTQEPSNVPPVAAFELLDGAGAVTTRAFVGENVSANAATSHDPDGSIVNHTWRLLRYGYYDPEAPDQYGPELRLNLATPGDRTLVLIVRDDHGASRTAFQTFSVNQHRIETGTLILGQSPLAVGPAGAKNYSLPVTFGALALSINATFPKDPISRVHLEIRAPNGTVLNRSEAVEGPLWAVAMPQPGVVGNYTAHISLVAGAAVEFRLEFAAWYGYM